MTFDKNGNLLQLFKKINDVVEKYNDNDTTEININSNRFAEFISVVHRNTDRLHAVMSKYRDNMIKEVLECSLDLIYKSLDVINKLKNSNDYPMAYRDSIDYLEKRINQCLNEQKISKDEIKQAFNSGKKDKIKEVSSTVYDLLNNYRSIVYLFVDVIYRIDEQSIIDNSDKMLYKSDYDKVVMCKNGKSFLNYLIDIGNTLFESTYNNDNFSLMNLNEKLLHETIDLLKHTINNLESNIQNIVDNVANEDSNKQIDMIINNLKIEIQDIKSNFKTYIDNKE